MTEGGLKTVKCPQCNKVSNLPEEGVDGLITSLAIRNLADRHPEGIKQRRNQLRKDLKKQNTVILEEEKEVQKHIIASVNQEVREVEKAVEAVIAQAQETISQIRDFGQSKISQSQKTIAQIKGQTTEIEHLQDKLKTMADYEFQTKTDALVNQMGKLKINRSPVHTEEQTFGRFVRAKRVELGRFVKSRRLNLMHAFGDFEGSCGIAAKSNGIVAVCDYQSHLKQAIVYVYKYNNGQNEQQFQFTIAEANVNYPDIAVSSGNKYLIAKGCPGFDVYSSDGNLQRTVKVTTIPNDNVLTVSLATTKDDRILAGSVIGGEGEKSGEYFTTVHDTEGNILKTMPIRIEPLRIADVHGTYVAVSNGHVQGKVCVYDLDTGAEPLTLDIPMVGSICYDEDSDCLLVGRGTEKGPTIAVFGSWVIQQHCRITGKLVAVLAHGLCGPYGMTITPDGMLAIADYKSVKVYTQA